LISFSYVPHIRSKRILKKDKNDIEESSKIEEDPDIKLERDLKEMETLMISLKDVLNENDQILSMPDNQEEFFFYNHINNQSFADKYVDYDIKYMNNQNVILIL
jgi:hypothetical protein